ncbi:MAG TPA: sigma-70 region 4 domain-containing protein, partial [Trebonia sp.]|nr:sigma-70 region 4 domain-containing protein [Trebonia sp.]
DQDQVEELLERIDAERAGRGLIAALAMLPERERAVIELVDVAGLRPKDAATVLGLTPGTVRMRLMRGRARLRRQAARDAPASARPPEGTAYGSRQHNHGPDEGDRK